MAGEGRLPVTKQCGQSHYSVFNIKKLLDSGYDSAGYSVNLKG